MSARRTLDEIAAEAAGYARGCVVTFCGEYEGFDVISAADDIRAACVEHARNETERLRAEHAAAVALLRECERELWLGGSVVEMRERIRAALAAWEEAAK